MIKMKLALLSVVLCSALIIEVTSQTESRFRSGQEPDNSFYDASVTSGDYDEEEVMPHSESNIVFEHSPYYRPVNDVKYQKRKDYLSRGHGNYFPGGRTKGKGHYLPQLKAYGYPGDYEEIFPPEYYYPKTYYGNFPKRGYPVNYRSPYHKWKPRHGRYTLLGPNSISRPTTHVNGIGEDSGYKTSFGTLEPEDTDDQDAGGVDQSQGLITGNESGTASTTHNGPSPPEGATDEASSTSSLSSEPEHAVVQEASPPDGSPGGQAKAERGADAGSTGVGTAGTDGGPGGLPHGFPNGFRGLGNGGAYAGFQLHGSNMPSRGYPNGVGGNAILSTGPYREYHYPREQTPEQQYVKYGKMLVGSPNQMLHMRPNKPGSNHGYMRFYTG